jgi:hypothetical protein
MAFPLRNRGIDSADDTPADDYTEDMKTTLRLLLLAAFLLLAACGNKGDLVMPTKPAPTHG